MAATGGCLCGAVAYEIDQPISDVIACHCTDCQKASGAGLSHNAVIQTTNLAFTKGEPRTYAKVVDSGRTLTRYFCGDCGTQLFSQRSNAPEMMVVKAGSLDDRSALRQVMEIWTSSANPWVPRDGNVPQHEGNRPMPKAD
ncbi:MAG: GFA family protein [Alphaproteobacteria bacterium]|jgi:hypothetical protein|nr:GFA family protein [Rhodospirillaceae bacterium]MBT6508990.1 GFA family protein [Rhodospirillaceae bacterium]MBT7646124.1 GFA family protein [Rhodospirillaceae bacterium]MDG2479453.1 GFA family protein [Alphaproteobacteria bacterium]